MDGEESSETFFSSCSEDKLATSALGSGEGERVVAAVVAASTMLYKDGGGDDGVRVREGSEREETAGFMYFFQPEPLHSAPRTTPVEEMRCYSIVSAEFSSAGGLLCEEMRCWTMSCSLGVWERR